jgi:acyl-CoA synthetase (AMP-forming)/AMP-acid ligase II
VRGGVVFKEYFGKPEATAKEFKEGWFCTGDIAEYNTELQSYVRASERANAKERKPASLPVSAKGRSERKPPPRVP